MTERELMLRAWKSDILWPKPPPPTTELMLRAWSTARGIVDAGIPNDWQFHAVMVGHLAYAFAGDVDLEEVLTELARDAASAGGGREEILTLIIETLTSTPWLLRASTSEGGDHDRG